MKRVDVISSVVLGIIDRAPKTTVESRRIASRIIGSVNDGLKEKKGL